MDYKIEILGTGCLLFTIDRSEKRNAINYEVMHGLSEAIERAKSNDIKAFAVTGSGASAFCSGGDLSIFHLLRTKEEAYPMLSKMAGILYALMTLNKPTLAILNGTAIGGGMELAAACDFRLAKSGMQAGFVQGQQAITTGWGGGAILAEKLPPHSAMKLLMEARLHSAEYLKEIGFIHELYTGDAPEAAVPFFEKMLANDGSVLQSYKSVWIRKWEKSGLRERIESEVEQCAILWESPAHHEKVNTFLAKKKGDERKTLIKE